MTDRISTTLDGAIAHTATEIGRTDTKAGLLLTLDGLLVAALGLSGTDLSGPALVLGIIGAVALVASVLLALHVIRPRVGHRYGDRASFDFFATATDDDMTEALAEDQRRDRLRVLSRIALRKMRMLKVAGDTALVAVVAIAAAILTN